jgi:hypothetical protein
MNINFYTKTEYEIQVSVKSFGQNVQQIQNCVYVCLTEPKTCKDRLEETYENKI